MTLRPCAAHILFAEAFRIGAVIEFFIIFLCAGEVLVLSKLVSKSVVASVNSIVEEMGHGIECLTEIALVVDEKLQ